ncbi:MAG TPA: CobD/CbiB family cobalamin biosynthesis protein, partial [Anaerolineae bacterium]|nr:CobD/CbiB family cobalamin biosynthesis protein [Anaerolineae bacterium]
MQRALTILLALALDLAFGDPPNRFHPVVLMGRWLSWGRRLAPQQHRFWFGAGWIVAGLALFTLPWLKRATSNEQLTMNNEQLTMNNPPTLQPSILPSFHPSLLPSLLLKPIFAYRNLRRSVNEVAEALAADNLPEARRLLSWHLVSRDTSELTAEEVAGAAIESLAENLTDSLAAPLLAYAIGGLPAAWGYRFVNTADAMWGYRTAEFEALGKFAARLEDALNWLPARLTGW